jgi:uncharacterized membrane protein
MKQLVKYIILSFLGLIIGSLVVSIWLPIREAFRIVFGSVYVLFLPGFVLSFIFSPIKRQGEKEIDIIERIALSFALSIAIVPLLVFYLNLVGIKINVLNVAFVIVFIIIGSIGVIWWRKRKNSLTES